MVSHLIEAGLQHHQAGRLHDAKLAYEQILALQPRHADALHLSGVVALQLGDAEHAIALIGRAIQVQPRNPAFHANLAQAHLALNHAAEAHDAFRRAARLDSSNPQFATGAANCLALLGRVEEAERQLRRVLKEHPRDALAWFNLGKAVSDQGRHPEAADCQRRAIQLDAGFADAWNELGRALHALEQFDEAERAYRQHLALQPDSAAGHGNLASLLIDRGRFSEAADVCRGGIDASRARIRPATLYLLLGSALAHEGRLTAARTALQTAVELAPDDARTLMAYGHVLMGLGEHEKGRTWLERGLGRETSSREFRYGMATVRLSLGELQSGWRDYESRPARGRHENAVPVIGPGQGDLTGKRICLVPEQGLGDQLFFLRFAPELAARGARISCLAGAQIASLLARSPIFDRVVPESNEAPAADWTIPMGSLPLALGSLASSPGKQHDDAQALPLPGMLSARPLRVFFPALPPALRLAPLPDRVQSVRETLARLGPPPYVGLTWRGGTPAAEQRGAFWALHKEIALADIGAAVRSGGTLLALQRKPRPGEIETLAGHAEAAVHDLSALNDDLEAMLALLSVVEEYVGVSNTNMHLRAGAGKTARVLVPLPAEWRWMCAGRESPWFPGFRVYRQQPGGGWDAAMARLKADLGASHGAR